MEVENYNISVKTTDDCVSVLNIYHNSNWKRKTKFNIKPTTDKSDDSIVRVFTDGEYTISIVSNDDGTTIIPKDLSELRSVIAAIQKLAKKYFTHDYGDTYLNLMTMDLWVSGGDGGIFYSDKSAKALAKMMDEDGFPDDECDDCPDFDIPELNSTTFEAECSPTSAGEGSEWVFVAKCVDLCDIDY
jgi:hypothetical protein